MAGVLGASPIPRHAIFVLADGSFVVQWDEKRVQELLNGRYREFDEHDYRADISDYELSQLQAAGRIEHYDAQSVWLYSLPELDSVEVDDYDTNRSRVRSFYLNTTLPGSLLEDVQSRLQNLQLADEFLARVRGDLVAILGKNGAPFHHLKVAERAQRQLMSRAPDIFQNTAIAFVETTQSYSQQKRQTPQTREPVDSESVQLSLSDTTVSCGKRVLLITSSREEQQALQALFTDMEMEVRVAATAVAGLELLEDFDPDLLVMSAKLPDMHGWEMLAKIKEIGTFQDLPKIMIADYQSSPESPVFALTVGKVDVYLVKPVSMVQLRQHVWMTLKNHHEAER